MSFNLKIDLINNESDITNFIYSKYNWTTGSARYVGLMTQKTTGNILLTVGAQDFIFSTGGTLKPGDWANITFTQSGEGETRGDLKLYFDGTLIASINTPLPTQIEDGVIRLHNGRFSDLAVWDRVLDGQEVAQATNAMKRGCITGGQRSPRRIGPQRCRPLTSRWAMSGRSRSNTAAHHALSRPG